MLQISYNVISLFLTVDCSSNSDSGPNSPPAGPHALPNGSLASLHSKEVRNTGCKLSQIVT